MSSYPSLFKDNAMSSISSSPQEEVGRCCSLSLKPCTQIGVVYFFYYSPHLVAFLYISMHLCCVNKNSFHYYLVASLICCMLTHSYAYQRLQVVQRGLWGKTLGMRASHLRPARPFGLPRPMRCPLCHLAAPLPTFRRWFERACRRSDLDASASPASV